MSKFLSLPSLSLALTVALGGGPTQAATVPPASFGTNVRDLSITAAEVEAAQKAWGKALIEISETFERKGQAAATRLATKVLDTAYAYDAGGVLFKPTLASGPQSFRMTKAGALAYFVGGDKAYPNDPGFALRGWKQFSYENAGVLIDGNSAITMGKVHLIDKNGEAVSVDKTWGFRKNPSGVIRIFLHHSSLPYQPAKPTT